MADGHNEKIGMGENNMTRREIEVLRRTAIVDLFASGWAMTSLANVFGMTIMDIEQIVRERVRGGG